MELDTQVKCPVQLNGEPITIPSGDSISNTSNSDDTEESADEESQSDDEQVKYV